MLEATSIYIYIMPKSEIPALAPYPGAMESSSFESMVYRRKPQRAWTAPPREQPPESEPRARETLRERAKCRWGSPGKAAQFMEGSEKSRRKESMLPASPFPRRLTRGRAHRRRVEDNEDGGCC